MRTRSYSEVSRFSTFEERFEYLRLEGAVGRSTFGFDRHINQRFYTSAEWKNVRNLVIVRDEGCDLGIPGFEIHGRLLIHHINPLTVNDVIGGEEWIFNPEYLITTTHNTHNAIHYSDANLLVRMPTSRESGDTKLW